MDSQFAFPTTQPVRRRPTLRPAGGARESNALRASVLDVALELGLVGGGVGGWMFDNKVLEEAEEEPVPAATKVESVSTDNGPDNDWPPSSYPTPALSAGHSAPTSPSLQSPVSSASAHGGGAFSVPFPAPPPPPPAQPAGKKLRKRRDGRDGYESEGYTSEGPAAKGKGKVKTKTKKKEKHPDAGAETDGESKAAKSARKAAEKEQEKAEAATSERGRKKSVLAAAAKSARRAVGGGNDSDDGGTSARKDAKKEAKMEKEAKKAREKEEKKEAKLKEREDDAGYATDGTPRRVRRFFALGGRSSKGDLKAEAAARSAVPPLPALGAGALGGGLGLGPGGGGSGSAGASASLPIAERFATTLGPGGFSGSVEDLGGPSRSRTPLPTRGASPLPPRGPSPLPPRAPSPQPQSQPDQQSQPQWQPQKQQTPEQTARISQISHASSSASSGVPSPSSPPSSSVHASSAAHATENAHVHWGAPSVSSVATGASAMSLASTATSHTASTGSGSGASNNPPALRPPAVSFARAPSPDPPSSRSGRSPNNAKSPPVAPISIMKALRLKASLDSILPGRGSGGKDAGSSSASINASGSISPNSHIDATYGNPYSPISPSPSTPATPFIIVPSTPASPASSPGFYPPAPMVAPVARARSRSPTRSPFPLRPVSSAERIPPATTATTFISAPNTAALGIPRSPRAPSPARLIIPPGGGGYARAPSPAPRSPIRSPSPVGLPRSPSPMGFRRSPSMMGLPRSPSPADSALLGAHVLAYYAMPPPSPPPNGPLPPPPPAWGAPYSPNSPNGAYAHSPTSPFPHSPTGVRPEGPSPAALRQRVIDRTPRTLPPELSAALRGGPAIQRGKESPFPVRPVPGAAAEEGPASGAGAAPGPAAQMLDARRALRRFPSPVPPADVPEPESDAAADRYAQAKRRAAEMHAARQTDGAGRRRSWLNVDDAEDEDEDAAEVDPYGPMRDQQQPAADEDENGVDLAYALGGRPRARAPPTTDFLNVSADVLAPPRPSLDHSDESHYPPSADPHGAHEPHYGFMTADPYAQPTPRPRKTSSGAKDDGALLNPRGTQYSNYTFAETTGDRLSRWSGSIYSRTSIMDEDASGATRDRLVRRVEAMLAREDAGDADRSSAAGTQQAYVNLDVPDASQRTWGRF